MSQSGAAEPRKPDLFIVDNSLSGWNGIRYLEEWSKISNKFDIATGYFEIGALLALDGKWQGLDKIRILMGSEATARTRQALLDAVKMRSTEKLDDSLEYIKEENPFLRGVPAILDAIRSNQIECRIYDREKFHAKAYITHAKLEIIGAQALVGSSNFTYPGLTRNIELNVKLESSKEVGLLQDWFQRHWDDAKEINENVIQTIYRHSREFTPFDVYAKALQEFFRGHELTATEWEETRSKMYHMIDRYQKEAYWAMMKIANQFGGAFLCDGVGLGKTFVGLMLIERLILHEGKRVVLFAPKATKEAVWEPHLKDWLSHCGGGDADFSNLAVFSHTDLSRKGSFPQRFERIAELADVVIIDEAHHFRNPGRRGDEENEPSRYYRLYNLLDKSIRPKTVFMLTATPINNRLSDFRHMAELFTRCDETYFARTLGINNLTAHFSQMERALRDTLGHDIVDVEEVMAEAQKVLEKDQIFKKLVVQRSRAYAKASQMREKGKTAVFPERASPVVAEYSIRKSYSNLLNMFEDAFDRDNPLFTLAMYYPLAWYIGDDDSIDPLEKGRQEQVVGLIRTNFLKRFESSVVAFELSCERLMKKLLAFIEIHSETDSEKRRLEKWKKQNEEILGYSYQRRLDYWASEEDEDYEEEDLIPPEILKKVEKLDRDEYDLVEMMHETFFDLNQIASFLKETSKFEPKNDDKLKKLIRLLNSKKLQEKKVIIFTEFADTARYLKTQIEKAGFKEVEQIDGGTSGNRADIIKRFSPYYNGTTSSQLSESGLKEIRILISTDVLSEGLNLQDATLMINYDIHWNPVRLMQRIGRVDRRMNPEIEKMLIRDHPDVASERGKVSYWNFLPPDELNRILSLYKRVTQKTLLISKTLGIEGKKLLTPEDDFEALKEFNSSYEGTKSAIEEMHLEYQEMLEENPELSDYLKELPNAIFSGREKNVHKTKGVFFCYTLPALDNSLNEFTYEAGTTQWYYYDMALEIILEEPDEIIENIRSTMNTKIKCIFTEEVLVNIKKKIKKHITNTYLKRIDAPIGVEPLLKCWMELNEG